MRLSVDKPRSTEAAPRGVPNSRICDLQFVNLRTRQFALLKICERGGEDEESKRGEDGEFTEGGTAGVGVEDGRSRREVEVVRARRDNRWNLDGNGGFSYFFTGFPGEIRRQLRMKIEGWSESEFRSRIG